MGGLTAPNKTSCTKTRQKAFKCTVHLTLHAVTCPGVLLPSNEDIYLRVRIMGQDHKSKCASPAFPLLLHEKMVFTKTFTEAIDPGDVADHLESDTTCFELIQLIPPEGEILATLEENTRIFLYPNPRLTPHAPDSDREILMKKSVSFPGIPPKVEFSTTSVIEECNLKGGQSTFRPLSPSPAKPHHIKTTPKTAKSSTARVCGYQMPTVASLGRSLSPYTHRKMCQLSEEARQRLSHLQLGPYSFKKESAPQPPFVVPHSPSSSLIEYSTPPSACLSSSKKASFPRRSVSFAGDLTDPELYGSFQSKPSPTRGRSAAEPCTSLQITRSPPQNRAPKCPSIPLTSSHREQSPLLTHSTLRERFQSPSSPSQYEEIHNRVQRILRTQSARCKLTFDDENEVSKQNTKKNLASSIDGSRSKPKALIDRVISGEPSVHLDNRTFWTNKAARYTGNSHRDLFEDSLDKVYANLYREASGRTESSSRGTW